MLGMRSSHVGDHPVFPVQTLWDGLGCLLGLFAHLTDSVQLLITFKHCLGMLTKTHTHNPAYPYHPPLPGGGGLCDTDFS